MELREIKFDFDNTLCHYQTENRILFLFVFNILSGIKWYNQYSLRTGKKRLFLSCFS